MNILSNTTLIYFFVFNLSNILFFNFGSLHSSPDVQSEEIKPDIKTVLRTIKHLITDGTIEEGSG